MKTSPLILFVLLLISCSENRRTTCDYINEYYPKVYKAQLNYNQKNYKKAFDLYTLAFESCEPKNTVGNYEMNKYAETAAILGKKKIALDFIERNLNHGMLLRYYTNNPNFFEVLKTERGKKIISNYDSLRKRYLENINIELRNEIQKMIKEDQAHVREQEKRNAVFKKNTKRLIEIFETIGYPGEDIVGPYNVDFQNADITILLLHTSDSIRVNYFIPKLEQYVKNGTCDPKTLGAVIDNYHLFNDDPQIIGTYEKREENMIPDTNQVNKNRIKIGLPTLGMDKKL